MNRSIRSRHEWRSGPTPGVGAARHDHAPDTRRVIPATVEAFRALVVLGLFAIAATSVTPNALADGAPPPAVKPATPPGSTLTPDLKAAQTAFDAGNIKGAMASCHAALALPNLSTRDRAVAQTLLDRCRHQQLSAVYGESFAWRTIAREALQRGDYVAAERYADKVAAVGPCLSDAALVQTDALFFGGDVVGTQSRLKQLDGAIQYSLVQPELCIRYAETLIVNARGPLDIAAATTLVDQGLAWFDKRRHPVDDGSGHPAAPPLGAAIDEEARKALADYPAGTAFCAFGSPRTPGIPAMINMASAPWHGDALDAHLFLLKGFLEIEGGRANNSSSKAKPGDTANAAFESAYVIFRRRGLDVNPLSDRLAIAVRDGSYLVPVAVVGELRSWRMLLRLATFYTVIGLPDRASRLFAMPLRDDVRTRPNRDEEALARLGLATCAFKLGGSAEGDAALAPFDTTLARHPLAPLAMSLRQLKPSVAASSP